jgi:hypothetical protein
MRPGQVCSDKQAFDQVLARLENDVGTMHFVIAKAKEAGAWKDTAPLWGLVRMTFPIAESVGALIHDSQDGTVQNLILILENEFEAVRPGAYKGKANILALLFRHSLTHTDEMRSLLTNGKEVGWSLSWNMRADHMKVLKPAPGIYGIHFDITAFYDDLVNVCRAAVVKTWNGRVMNRYNDWLKYDLDKKGGKNVKDAIAEINAL